MLKISPADVEAARVRIHLARQMSARRANCHRLGYHGPLTRSELAARITP